VPPAKPILTVPRSAHVSPGDRQVAHIAWGNLSSEERANGVTDLDRTVVDCARTLPFGQALAVADSALRSGRLTKAQLLETALAAPRTGRSRAVRVAEAADPRAANPFESMLRGIALDVPGLSIEPQVHIGGTEFIGAADLVDVRLGVVIEAESWAYHGDRSPFDRDVRRYTAMVRAGWRVVRFLWDDVYRDSAYVHAVLADLVTEAHLATQVG
jgi:very-short-patch-repair endonuclease